MLKTASIFSLLLLLQGCGFHLRGEGSLPTMMQNVLLEGPEVRTMQREFEYLLLRQGGGLATSRAGASMIVQIQSYQQDSRVVAMDSLGYTREKEVSVTLSYAVLDPQRQPLLSTRQLRLFTDVLVDKNNVLASQRAETEAYQVLQRRLAARLLDSLRFELQGLSGNETGQ